MLAPPVECVLQHVPHSFRWVQAGAKKLFKERVWPDMIARHKQGTQGRRRSRLAPTLNAEFAGKFEKALADAFGADGGKLAAMDSRWGGPLVGRALWGAHASPACRSDLSPFLSFLGCM